MLSVESQVLLGAEDFFVRRATRQYSNDEVNSAGLVLASHEPSAEDFNKALAVINNWRAAHYFPLNTFQTTLRRKAADFKGSVVVQRIKRLKAIQHKLQKHTDKPIPLSEMQDIGGCRCVLKNPTQVDKLHAIYRNSDLRHTVVRCDDYIRKPKFSGYRGIHLVYSYRSDKKKTYNGMHIEVQLRSQLQHAWATAVEIVGFFRRELLKSSEGDNVWKHFFKLMAADIAFEEQAPFGIPGMPSSREKVREQLVRCAAKLEALPYLETIGQGVANVAEVNTSGAHYFLLELDTAARELKVTGYKLNAREQAIMDAAAVERAIFGSKEHDAVLVSAESMADLKRAYVNYFLDVHQFIAMVEAATGTSTNGKKSVIVSDPSFDEAQAGESDLVN